MGDVTPPKKEQPGLVVVAPVPKVLGLVKIPSQAMKSFKRILDLCEDLEVRLTHEQSQMLLESLQSMPTPKRMMDAKAIFELIEALQK